MHQDKLTAHFEDIVNKSSYLAKIKRVNTFLEKEDSTFRPLTPQEIKRLEKQNNVCAQWDMVKVKPDFRADRVKNCILRGSVYLGAYIGEETGLYGALISDTIIGDNVFLFQINSIEKAFIEAGCQIIGATEISGQSQCRFGNGSIVSPGSEAGGRDIPVFAEIDFDLARSAASAKEDTAFLNLYHKLVEQYVSLAQCDYTIIGEGSVIKGPVRVVNSFVSPFSKLCNASALIASSLVGNQNEAVSMENGAFVSESIIQWNCHLNTFAVVENSVLMEASGADRHGKILHAIIGSNTEVAEGEVCASLVGPFTGFHHQSLLISTFWPGGKGNISYGANVGSNHTGKMPDQSMLCGEGVFFGLGSNIKFPTNFQKAPYSIVATAVNTLPQRVEMPFSLINTPATSDHGISPAYNEIIPGWVLSDNIFAVIRNERKYKKRDRSKRTKLEHEVFRPEIIMLMCEARDQLNRPQDAKKHYTDRDIKGLGKNYLSEDNRKKAIKVYTKYIRFFALKGLKRRIVELKTQNDRSVERLFSEAGSARWRLEREIIKKAFGLKDPSRLLEMLKVMVQEQAEAVERSKAKDDVRGARVIDNYAFYHKPAFSNALVREIWKESFQEQKEIDELKALFETAPG